MAKGAGTLVLGAFEGTELSPEELRQFSQYRVSGITLFRRNVPDPYSDLIHVTSKLQQFAVTAPLMIAIDQEGGRVRRIRDPFPDRGPAQKLQDGGMTDVDLREITNYGSTIGCELLKLGVNVNFAPVCDVLSDPSNEAIGDRVFGTEPVSVSRRAGAFLEGMEMAGVRGCLKHFPGQGAASADTHHGDAVVLADERTLQQRDLPPFLSLLPKTPMVMMSHCVFPAVDEQPASLSPTWIQQRLRNEYGFQGVVVSDDMLMEAIDQDLVAWQEQIVAAVAAGTDLLLVCRHVERVIKAVEALEDEARKSISFQERMNQAAGRVMKLRSTLRTTMTAS